MTGKTDRQADGRQVDDDGLAAILVKGKFEMAWNRSTNY